VEENKNIPSTAEEAVKEEKQSKKREKAPKEEKQTERKEGKKAPDLGMLDPHRRALYDMLPDGKFALDALVTQDVSVSDALATLTLFEVYGLVRVHHGGLYEKV
jgi:hypothetical protein